jgi:hypothetical protein
MRWIIAIVAFAGCRQILGIHDQVPAHDAAVTHDSADGKDGDAPDGDAPDAPPDAPVLAACPSNYDVITPSGARHRHVTTAVDWVDAVVDCADDANTGGIHTHLAVFANDAERAEIHALLPTTLWIGMTDINTEGHWQWVTLQPTGSYPQTTNPPFTPGQPDGQDCGAMDENGGFEDRECDGTADVPYLCECDTYVNTPSQY